MAAAAGVNRDENRPDLPLRSVPIYPCSRVQVEEMVFMAVINFKTRCCCRCRCLFSNIYSCHMMAMHGSVSAGREKCPTNVTVILNIAGIANAVPVTLY